MEKAKITAIFGRTGSGKTYLVKRILDRRKKENLIIWDFIGEYKDGLIFQDLRTLIKYLKHKISKKEQIKAIVRIPKKDFDKLCMIVLKTRKVIFLIEELGSVTSANFCPEYLEELVRYGRHRDIELIATSKRPAECSRFYTSQATDLILFKIQEPIDISYLVHYSTIEAKKAKDLSYDDHKWIRLKL